MDDIRLRIYLIRGEKQFINVQRATQNRMSTELRGLRILKTASTFPSL